MPRCPFEDPDIDADHDESFDKKAGRWILGALGLFLLLAQCHG